ncbi:putative ABC transporter permease [Eubacterium barkeri]|uniref:Uncharacterized membrane protein n=1 Tax=Eubacterium barkeri TaxID=1528 RepID=A0A1H3AV63_EUBBA|nr:hypothetical protein [Eubacterium barkeri]SDX33622.1 Uncharacterized membrane protein [Eubacterium barkeri]
MEQFFLNLSMLIIEFFIFAVIGWCMEVILKYFQYHRFINRGFLIGPYCPIYGAGVVAVTLLVGGMIGRHGTIGETFLAGFVICGILEYFTSWYMEKVFHARWWDYSKKPMNLNGRIWIGNLVLFGVASVGIIWLIDPLYFGLMAGVSPFVIQLLAIIIVVVMLGDYAYSHFLMNLVKREIDSQDADDTEEISRQVHAMLKDKQLLLRRIEAAYPNAQARPKDLMAARKEAKKAYSFAVKQVHQVAKPYERAIKEGQGRASTAVADLRQALEAAKQKEEAAKEKLHDLDGRIFKD